MKTISGPDIDQFIESLDSSDIIYIEDHIGNENDEGKGLLKFKQVLKNNNNTFCICYLDFSEVFFKYNPNIILFDKFIVESIDNLNRVFPEYKNTTKQFVFNFSINKRRYNRQRLLELLTKFNLYTESYSLCGYLSLNGFLPKTYLDYNTIVDTGFVRNHKTISNEDIYKDHLYDQVYSKSYISLITESDWFSPGTFITEKTIFAFDSKTIPLWVGGYGHANTLKSLGFDVFDDIIDHGYQYLSDPKERIDQAILLNLDILKKDIKYLERFFSDNIERFNKNRLLIRNNIFKTSMLTNLNNSVLSTEIKNKIKEFL